MRRPRMRRLPKLPLPQQRRPPPRLPAPRIDLHLQRLRPPRALLSLRLLAALRPRCAHPGRPQPGLRGGRALPVLLPPVRLRAPRLPVLPFPLPHRRHRRRARRLRGALSRPGGQLRALPQRNRDPPRLPLPRWCREAQQRLRVQLAEVPVDLRQQLLPQPRLPRLPAPRRFFSPLPAPGRIHSGGLR
uniref:Uncharacterized protein n=1 Tax=Arcella intermedia TaxID=1963864 RepID=A0A6B2LGB1_9EUKA